MSNIRIECDDNNTVRLWVDGEEIHDVVELNFLATVDNPKNNVRCSYWKHSRAKGGRLTVLNNEIIAEKVIVSE